MSDNVVLYCENLPTEGMETLIAELCPPELDLRFLYPVKNGKKGDFEDADYILASIHKIGKDEMDRAKNLKLIHVPATGYNHVDLEYAKQKGIPVCNSNGENATTTAEFTIALMLACMRRLSMIDRRVQAGRVAQLDLASRLLRAARQGHRRRRRRQYRPHGSPAPSGLGVQGLPVLRSVPDAQGA